jgi:hypothetical protein
MPAILPAVIGWPVSPETSPYFPPKIFHYLQQDRTETLDAKGNRSDVCKYDYYVLTDGKLGSKKGRVNREGKSWTDSCKRLKSVNFFVFGDATASVSHCPLRHDGHIQSPSVKGLDRNALKSDVMCTLPNTVREYLSSAK